MDNAAILAAVRREFPKHTWDAFVDHLIDDVVPKILEAARD